MYKLPFIEDPSEKLIDLACLRWNIQQCRRGLTAASCDKPQALMSPPVRAFEITTCQTDGRGIGMKIPESIPNSSQLREIILFGWTESLSTQSPNHCHIEFCKDLAAHTIVPTTRTCLKLQPLCAGTSGRCICTVRYLHSLDVDLADAKADDDSEDPIDSMSPWPHTLDWRLTAVTRRTASPANSVSLGTQPCGA